MIKISILASGSGSNAENIIKFFENHDNIQVTSVLCNVPDAYVLERAKNLNIPSYTFNRSELRDENGVLKLLQELDTDFIVLAGFLWLMPKHIVDAYPNKILNIHPALLPLYGGKGMYGMNVHNAVVEAKEKESGITIHYVNEQYDSGDIVFQAKCNLVETDSADDVAQKVHELEYIHFPKVIEEVILQNK